MTHFTAKIIPSPPTTQLIFDTRPSSHKTPLSTPAVTDAENSGLDSGAESERPPTPPTPLEEKEEVDLNFYAILDGTSLLKIQLFIK